MTWLGVILGSIGTGMMAASLRHDVPIVFGAGSTLAWMGLAVLLGRKF